MEFVSKNFYKYVCRSNRTLTIQHVSRFFIASMHACASLRITISRASFQHKKLI